ncbi:MAG: hypothetical protein OHK93_008417 [Ramalina farinacea]|uniref:Carbonic anhydrase n=1 Tax=Ramalina farinacea TaxID=258253 RepID=A0AA43QPG9_9LECA|nr:hypothetical protein [Ramalina farinacea]
MAHPNIKDLLERRKQSTATYTPFPLISEITASGEEAVVFRNPCGHSRHEIPGLVSLDHLLGGFTEVMVVHHTDCGTLHFKNEQIKDVLVARGAVQTEVEGMYFGGIDDLEQSVKDDVAILKNSHLMRPELKEQIRGFVFDIQTGKLSEVDL